MVSEGLQHEMGRTARGRIMTMDSAYHVDGSNRERDVVVTASYCGVLPARFIARHRPRATICVDCGVGPAGASVAGLWFFEALNIPAAVAAVMSVRLGDGRDVYVNGTVSMMNRPAQDCGVTPGLSVGHAASLMLANDPGDPSAEEVDNRSVVHHGPDGRAVVCIDSIAFARPEDAGTNVLVTAGHTGRSAVPYLRQASPHGFICSDGGRARDDSGIIGLQMVEPYGLAGATVDATVAAMGSGYSSYRDGIISAVNALAATAGVEVGMPAVDAARLLVEREPTTGDDDHDQAVH